MHDSHTPVRLRRGTILVLAAACGVAVGNIYFPQALTPLVATSFAASPDAAAGLVTATQLGYAAGIFLLVPLGDRVPHRTLIVALLVLTGLLLLAASAAPALPALVGAGAAIGATTVAAQVISPMVAGLVDADRRGQVFGTLLSGSICGMLVSRLFGGALGESLGWRAPYVGAAALTLVCAAVLSRMLPRTRPASRLRYPALLAEPLRLLRAEPDLRRSCLNQAAIFGAFSAVWTSVAFLLTSPAYGLGAGAVGVLALVGAATIVCAPLAGRRVDRHGPDAVNVVSMLGTIAAAALLTAGDLGGAAGLGALVAGTLLLDVAMQAGMLANHVRVYAIRGDARARLNTAYMTCAFLGGCAGSWLGALVYLRLGWPAVCGLVALLATLPLARSRSVPAHKPSPSVLRR